MSCRGANGWSSPAYLNIGGGSLGFQIGVAATDYVMLFMTPESARSLMESNFKLGANISVAAGPIGREAGADTDLKLNAQILSYSRARGLFAGVTINGATIRQDRDANERYYGTAYRTGQIVFDGLGGAPEPVAAAAPGAARARTSNILSSSISKTPFAAACSGCSCATTATRGRWKCGFRPASRRGRACAWPAKAVTA